MRSTQQIRNQFSDWLADEFRPSTLATSLLSGLLIYIFEIITVISFAALVFSGELAGQLPQALGYILVADAIMIAAISLLSSYPGTLGAAQDAPTAVLGLVAMQIVAISPALSTTQHYATVVVLVVVTTLMTGGLFILLGIFKLGGLARYLPYPVMGGFLASTGWLLARGGVELMVSIPFGSEWFEAGIILQWLPGTVLGLIILVGTARIRHPLTLPALLALGVLLFYLVAAFLNVSITQLEAEGWLIGSLPSGGLLRFPLREEILSQVSWSAVWGQIPNIAPAAIISVIALLLNSGGLELVIKKDIRLSRELVAAGVSNLFAGALGGLPGYHAISFSALNYNLSGGKRVVGLIIALLIGATMFLGTSLLSYIPTMLLGAVLVYLGALLLVEWVYQAWFKFPKVDFLIIISILGVILLGGFLTGVILGLVLAIIFFVVSYSNISVIKYALTGREYHSRVTRGPQQRGLLDALGDQIYILKLQGFIFFGTANSILSQVRERVLSTATERVRFVLLDFEHVSGLDSTALLSFTRLLHTCQEQDIFLVLTGLNQRAWDQFAHGGFQDQPDSLRFFADLDHGIEWCENLLIAENIVEEPAERDLVAELKAIVGEQRQVEKLLPHLHRQEYAPGETLISQGDEPDTIYFIESGQVTAQLEAPGQPPLRLETMRGGRAVGELGFYLGVRRTAAVIVDEPSVIYWLSKTDLANLEKTDPEAANLFHRVVVHLLGERVVHLIRTVNALER